MNQEETRAAANKAAKVMSDLLSASLDCLEIYLMPLANGKWGNAIATQFNNRVVEGIYQARDQLYELAATGEKEVTNERD